MDAHDRHAGVDYARMMVGIASLVIAVCFVVLTAWLVLAEQTTKLYESDNVVCASQPFSIQCFERKAR